MINRRSILKGIGAGFAGIFIAGGASYCYSLFGYLQRKPLIIGGSTAVKRFVEKLASAFVKKYQEVDLIVQGGHSYAGLIALNRGTVDLAMVSHNLKPDEDGVNLQSYLIGIEAIALVVHPNLGINNLSASNAKLIFEQKAEMVVALNRKCPEILRDLGPTIPLLDFIPTNVGTPSNQPQYYRINATYPFVNVYKRFVTNRRLNTP